MRKIIRLGDSTSHGGKVVSATSHVTVGGLPVARLGDRCTCPKRGHNNCVIVEGDPDWTIDGIPVALEGHKISCGAVLISSAPNTGREEWGSAAVNVSPAASLAALNQTSALFPEPAKHFDYDEHFILVNQRTGEPLDGWHYRIHALGETAEGITSDNGKTGLIGSNTPDSVKLDRGHQMEIGV